jgi:hypothetical protein
MELSTFWLKVPSASFLGAPRQARALGATAVVSHDVVAVGGRASAASLSADEMQTLHLTDNRLTDSKKPGLGGGSRVGAALWRVHLAGCGGALALFGNSTMNPLEDLPRPAPGASALDVSVLSDGAVSWERVALSPGKEDSRVAGGIPCARVGCSTDSDGGMRVFFFGGVGVKGSPLSDWGYVSWKSSPSLTSATVRYFVEGAASGISGAWPVPRAFATMTYVGRGSSSNVKALLIAGGLTAAGPTRDVNVLQLSGEMNWSKPTLAGPGPTVTPRSHHCAALVSPRSAAGSGYALVIFGGRGQEADLLQVETLHFSPDLATVSVKRHGGASLSGSGGVSHDGPAADAWHSGALQGGTPPHRFGMQCVQVDPKDALVFAQALRDTMSSAAAQHKPLLKRSRGGAAETAGSSEWIDAALDESTVLLVFGGARHESAARGGGGKGGRLVASVSDDAFLLQILPSSTIPAHVLSGVEAAALGVSKVAAAEAEAALIAPAGGAGSKRSAAALLDVQHTSAPTVRSSDDGGNAGGGTIATAAAAPRGQPQPHQVSSAAFPHAGAPSISPDVERFLRELVSIAPQLLSQSSSRLAPQPQALAVQMPFSSIDGSGTLASILEHVSKVSSRIETVLGAVQAVATSADARQPAQKAELSHLSESLSHKLSDVQRDVQAVMRVVDGQASQGPDRSVLSALQRIQDSLALSREASAKQLSSEADSLRSNVERLSNEAAVVRSQRDMLQRELEKAREQLQRVESDLLKEREKAAAAQVSAVQSERDKRAAEERAAAAEKETARLRAALQSEHDERTALALRLRRIEEACK